MPGRERGRGSTHLVPRLLKMRLQQAQQRAGGLSRLRSLVDTMKCGYGSPPPAHSARGSTHACILTH